MALNWSLEVVSDFIFASALLFSIIITLIKPNTKNIRSLFYIRLALCFGIITMLFDGIALLFVSEPMSILSGFMLVPLSLSMIVGVNYVIKDHFYSFGFLLAFGLSILFLYLGFQPGAIETRIQAGYVRLPWIGLFSYLAMIIYALIAGYLFYWGVKTVSNVPFLIRKEAILFFIGLIIYSLLACLFYLLYIFETFFIVVSNISGAIGLLCFMISIVLEPKLLYILPFTIYRVVVKDNKGHPLYDYDWSKSNVSENLFTGFINAMQIMSEEVIKMGGLLDINLKEGILILHESENITVGLITSKSSKLLRDSVMKFTFDFETKFQKKLKDSCFDMKEYKTAYELIEKHFSNFPSRLVPSKSHPLLLTEKLLKLPASLEDDLKKIISDEKDYDFIKSEIFRSPESSAAGFLTLYNEIKEELEKREKDQKKENNKIEM